MCLPFGIGARSAERARLSILWTGSKASLQHCQSFVLFRSRRWIKTLVLLREHINFPLQSHLKTNKLRFLGHPGFSGSELMLLEPSDRDVACGTPRWKDPTYEATPCTHADQHSPKCIMCRRSFGFRVMVGGQANTQPHNCTM